MAFSSYTEKSSSYELYKKSTQSWAFPYRQGKFCDLGLSFIVTVATMPLFALLTLPKGNEKGSDKT